MYQKRCCAACKAQGVEAKLGASVACATASMEGLTKRKAKILARQSGSMLAGRPAGGSPDSSAVRGPRLAKPRLASRSVSPERAHVPGEEGGMRTSWAERAEQLSAERMVKFLLSRQPPCVCEHVCWSAAYTPSCSQ